MALTKANIKESIYHNTLLPKQKCDEAVEAVIEIIKKTMENGEDVMISGFGKFTVKEKKARKGRNPATGDDLILPPRRVVTFKCSGKLRDQVNDNKKKKH